MWKVDNGSSSSSSSSSRVNKAGCFFLSSLSRSWKYRILKPNDTRLDPNCLSIYIFVCLYRLYFPNCMSRYLKKHVNILIGGLRYYSHMDFWHTYLQDLFLLWAYIHASAYNIYIYLRLSTKVSIYTYIQTPPPLPFLDIYGCIEVS